MKCDVCESEQATVFLSQLVDGKLQKVNLCPGCADEKGVTDPTGFALADMLQGMGKETVTEKPADPGELTCPSCGFTQTDFKKTGRFGCASCYDVFRDGLDSLLEAMHKHTRHVGKRPRNRPFPGPEDEEDEGDLPLLPELEEIENLQELANLGGTEDVPEDATEPLTPLSKLNELKESLQASVEAEDYEEAARLRDAIAQLEAQLKES